MSARSIAWFRGPRSRRPSPVRSCVPPLPGDVRSGPHLAGLAASIILLFGPVAIGGMPRRSRCRPARSSTAGLPQERGTGHGWPLFSAPWSEAAKTPKGTAAPVHSLLRDDATPVERQSQRVSRMARETSQGSHLALSLQVGVRFAASACGDVPHGDAASRQDGALRSASAVPVARSTTGAVASKS